MLSARIIIVFALVAAATAWPATKKPVDTEIIEDSDFFGFPNPWSSFVERFFHPLFNLFPKVNSFVPNVADDPEKFQITMIMKGFDKDDLKVKVRGCYVSIEGSHESKDSGDGIFSSSIMHQHYNIPENVSAADLTAKFYTKDGHLIISAPKSFPVNNEGVSRDVPIEVIDATYTAEKKDKTEIFTSPEPLPVQEDDRKEPTTPVSETEEPSVNENSIPHGSDGKP